MDKHTKNIWKCTVVIAGSSSKLSSFPLLSQNFVNISFEFVWMKLKRIWSLVSLLISQVKSPQPCVLTLGPLIMLLIPHYTLSPAFLAAFHHVRPWPLWWCCVGQIDISTPSHSLTTVLPYKLHICSFKRTETGRKRVSTVDVNANIKSL